MLHCFHASLTAWVDQESEWEDMFSSVAIVAAIVVYSLHGAFTGAFSSLQRSGPRRPPSEGVECLACARMRRVRRVVAAMDVSQSLRPRPLATCDFRRGGGIPQLSQKPARLRKSQPRDAIRTKTEMADEIAPLLTIPPHLNEYS